MGNHKKNLLKIAKKYVKEISNYIRENKIYVYQSKYDFRDDASRGNFIGKLNSNEVSIGLIEDPINIYVFTKENIKRS